MTSVHDRNAVTTAIGEPSTPRLRLQRSGSPYGLLDGGWWPRSTKPAAELPGLILALDHLQGPVIRILLHRDDWSDQPLRLGLAGRVIRVTYFASHPAGLLSAFTGAVTRGRIDLVVVPPNTGFELADAAMTIAATQGNHLHAQHILDRLTRASAGSAPGSGAEDVQENVGSRGSWSPDRLS